MGETVSGRGRGVQFYSENLKTRDSWGELHVEETII
jgi:hypothetical protein